MLTQAHTVTKSTDLRCYKPAYHGRPTHVTHIYSLDMEHTFAQLRHTRRTRTPQTYTKHAFLSDIRAD
jgi:hypothetical protein